MSSTQRVVLTVVICTGLLIVWQYLFAPRPGPVPPGGAPGAGQADGKAAADKGQPGKPAEAPASRPTKQGKKKPADPSLGPLCSEAEGEALRLEHEDAEVTFSNCGATLRHWVLKEPRYREVRGGKLVPVDLVRTPKKKGPWQIVTTFPDSAFEVPADARYRVAKRGPREVRYEWESSKVRVSKHFVLDKQRPMIWLTLRVRNLTDRALAQRLRISVYSAQEQQAEQGLANPYPRIATGLCFLNGKLERRSLGAIQGNTSTCSAEGCSSTGEGPMSQVGDVAWIASDDRYFLTSVVPKGKPRERLCELRQLYNREVVEAALLFSEDKLASDGVLEHRFAVYAGPKDIGELDAVKASGGGEGRLGDSIEFGWFSFLCRPMLALLKAFYALFGNWGIAIILLTVVVKLITLYPTQKSMRSMKALAKIKPLMDQLREKHKGDKQRLNQEMMQLYKTHKINPFGGCLPMLIQMPIWFALYRTLGNAVELYRSPFFGWITDLTAADPYYVLPILMGLAMFGQQAITPQAMDGMQAKMMKYFMPVMFTFMMLWLPSGLTLYIFVNTVLAMLHQVYMNRTDPDRGAPLVKSKPPGGGGGGGGAGGGSGPPPRERQRARVEQSGGSSGEAQQRRPKKRRRKSRKP